MEMKRWIHASTTTNKITSLAFCKYSDLGDNADMNTVDTTLDYAFAVNVESSDSASELFDTSDKNVKFIPVSVSNQGVIISKSDYLIPQDIIDALNNLLGLTIDVDTMLEIGSDAFNKLFSDTGIVKMWAPNFTTGSKNGYSLGIPNTSKLPRFAKKYILSDLLEANKDVSDLLDQNGYKLVWPENSKLVYITVV